MHRHCSRQASDKTQAMACAPSSWTDGHNISPGCSSILAAAHSMLPQAPRLEGIQWAGISPRQQIPAPLPHA